MLLLRVEHAECPITAMFDIDGEQTSDPDSAIAVYVLLPNNNILLVECQRRNIVESKVN